MPRYNNEKYLENEDKELFFEENMILKEKRNKKRKKSFRRENRSNYY